MLYLICIKAKGGLTPERSYRAVLHTQNAAVVLVFNDLNVWQPYKISTFKPDEAKC